MGKIRNKLLLAFILVSLIPLIALGGYALTSISKSLKEVSTGKLQDRVGLISFEIEDFLKNVSNDLFYLRDSVLLRDMVRDMANYDMADLETIRTKLEQDFLAFSKHKKIYHQVRFLDANGMEIVRVDRVDRIKSVVVPRERLQSKKKRYYFADTAKLPKGELMISPLDLNREHGQVEKPLRPVIRYGTPVYDENGQLRGIVLVNVMAETFLDLVRKKNTGQEQVLFMDGKGYYYVHPDRAREWGRKSDLGHGANFTKDYPEVAGQVVGARSPVTIDQKNYLVAVSPVFLDKGRTRLLGDVVDIVPAEIVYAPVLTFRNIFLAISAGVFLFTLVLALNLAKSITEPIVYLTRITHDMSKGKLGTPVSVTTKDETRLLAESVERLRKSMVILLKRMKKK